MAAGKFRKPGLVHARQRVEVETVTKAMRKECDNCHDAPKRRRLLVQQGSGRTSKTTVLCETCGIPWLEARSQEFQRASSYLQGTTSDPIRLVSIRSA